MTGLLPRLFACLLLLSLTAGGMPAQAMPWQPMQDMAAAHGAGAQAPDCHDAPGAGHERPAISAHPCCAGEGAMPGHDCGPGCACPLVATGVVPAPGRDARVPPQATRTAAAARGDPGRAPVPPRRPPIA